MAVDAPSTQEGGEGSVGQCLGQERLVRRLLEVGDGLAPKLGCRRVVTAEHRDVEQIELHARRRIHVIDVLQRVSQQLLGARQVLVVIEDLGQQAKRLGADRTRKFAGQHALEPDAGLAPITGNDVGHGGLKCTRTHRNNVAGGCEGLRAVEQHGCCLLTTSGTSGDCAVLDRQRDCLIGNDRTEGEMVRSLLGTGRKFSESKVEPSALRGRSKLGDRGSKQRVGEDDAVDVDVDDTGPAGNHQRDVGILTDDARNCFRCRSRHRRRHQQRRSRPIRQRHHSFRQQGRERARNRQWLAVSRLAAVVDHRSNKLDGEERIAGRRIHHLVQRRAGENPPEAGADHVVKFVQADRPNRDPLHPVWH